MSADGVDAFFAKAEAREPMLRAGLGFVPPASHTPFKAWAGLLAELRECAFELSDPRVTEVKAGWWAEELDGMARGAARHPLSRALLARDVIRVDDGWSRIGEALLAAATDLDPPATLQDAIDALTPFAGAVIAVERRLFAASGDERAQGRALALHWLRHRLERGLASPDHARVPLALFARHGLRRDQLATEAASALRRDWAAQLASELDALTDSRDEPYLRRLSRSEDRRALAATAAGRLPSSTAQRPFVDVWRAWRLARNAALQVRGPIAAST